MHSRVQVHIFDAVKEWMSTPPARALLAGMLDGLSVGATAAARFIEAEVEVDEAEELANHHRRMERLCRREQTEDPVLEAQVGALEEELKMREHRARLVKRLEELKARLATGPDTGDASPRGDGGAP